MNVSALFIALLIVGAVYIAAFVSYRVFFHPLARYPGNFWAKVTSLNTAYHAVIGDRHLNAYKLHQKYGSVVRLGPNLVSFNTQEALRDIYNVNANVRKGFLYHVVTSQFGFASTFSTQDKAVHSRKKRILAPAFTDASLRNMEEYVLKHIRTFIQKIGPAENAESSVTDLGEWSGFLTFDVMGDLSFGRDFGMLENDVLRDIPRLGNAAGHRALIAGSSQVVFRLGLGDLLTAKVSADGAQFKTHVIKTLKTRLASDVDRKDFLSYILRAKENGKNPYELPELIAETRSLMVAGSDTTATQLAANFFYITQNATTWDKLSTEIRTTFSSVEDIHLGTTLESCHYLKAVVEETLRITPSVPGYLPRETLQGGITIDGQHFPAGVEVAITTYALHHNETYFPDSHTHNPDRWIPSADNPEEAIQERLRACFAPFSQGSRMCIGRKLAYFELWIALARAVFEYDMKYVGRGKETSLGPEVRCEYALKDAFAAQREGPLIEFRRRGR